jgi:uncharacterized membrane protein
VRDAKATAVRYLPPTTLALLAALGYAAAAIFRHDRFGSNAYDLGIFDQYVWSVSRFSLGPNTVLRLPTALGDHFHPIVWTLAPLYWIWSDPRVLLGAQAVLLAAASLPVFAWARERLGTPPAYAFQLSYLVFWGVLGGDIFDFHEVAFAAPIVSVALYALLTRRDSLLVAMTVLALLTKEDLALTFAAIGVYVALVQRRRRFGAAIVGACIAAFALLIKVVLPALADQPYSHWSYTALGSGPGSALKHVVTQPIDSVRTFFSPAAKRSALFNLFGTWLFLPLASPLLIVMIPTLAERFLSSTPSYWAQGFHYSLVIAPMLAFAAIDATERLARLARGSRPWFAYAAAGAVLLTGFAFTFGRIKPLDELRREPSALAAASIDSCLRTIPPHASVAATSALVPHISDRRSIYQLDARPLPGTPWLALDTQTWIYPLTLAGIGRIVDRSLANGYVVRCSTPRTVVLARGTPRGKLNPELAALLRKSERQATQ